MKPLAFLFDRNFPRPIARMIGQYAGDELLARFQDDDARFEIDTADVDIIRTLSDDETYRWVLISCDKRITRRPAERAAARRRDDQVLLLRQSVVRHVHSRSGVEVPPLVAAHR